jgi:hypothetical protein
MNIYFKYEQNGDLVLKGYIYNQHFEFQAYNRCASINFPDSNQSFILAETELNHFLSYMPIKRAKWLIRKGFIYFLISKLQNV